MNFSGIYERKMDTKGRIIIPTQFGLNPDNGLYLLRKENNLFRYIIQDNVVKKNESVQNPLNYQFSLEDTLKKIKNSGTITNINYDLPRKGTIRINLGIENYHLINKENNNIILCGLTNSIMVYLGNQEKFNEELNKY